MSRSREPRLVALSGRIYARLLALYPREHRREYGAAMSQLFRDQCRDAWTEAGGRGLALLWLRIAVDLLKTLMLEHLQNLKQGKSMLNKTLQAFRYNPVTALILVGVVLVVALSLLALSTPEQYASIARIKVERIAIDPTRQREPESLAVGYDPDLIQGELKMIQSEAVFARVARKLNLTEAWAKSSAGGAALNEAETIKLLREKIDLRPVRNTSLIEIRVHSTNAREAANIANEVAEAYSGQKYVQRLSTEPANSLFQDRFVYPEIVDTAVPGLRPVGPNKQFIVFLGLAGGVGGFLLLAVLNRRPSPPAATT
jgi:capsular polysaccharide biosynthesis protein